jgi:hypothetical protein
MTMVGNNLRFQAPSYIQLLKFGAYCAVQLGKSTNTVSSAFTALKTTCGAFGHDCSSFAHSQVRNFLGGLRKVRKAAVRPKRLPITIWALAHFVTLVNLADYTQHVTFAAMIISFYGLLRASEFVSKADYGCTLLRRHVTILSDRVILHIARSKTDTYDVGVDVTLYANAGSLCPHAWASWVWAHAPNKSPDAPFLQSANGEPITYKKFQAFIKMLGDKAGWDPTRVSSHSIRIGACTSLVELGMSTTVVKDLGRWASDSYLVYVRISDNHRREVSATFAKAANDRSAPVFCGMTLDKFQQLNSTTFGGFTPSQKR